VRLIFLLDKDKPYCAYVALIYYNWRPKYSKMQIDILVFLLYIFDLLGTSSWRAFSRFWPCVLKPETKRLTKAWSSNCKLHRWWTDFARWKFDRKKPPPLEGFHIKLCSLIKNRVYEDPPQKICTRFFEARHAFTAWNGNLIPLLEGLCTANPTWGDIFESSKLGGKRCSSFELWALKQQ